LRTASDAQESEHRVTAPITAATCNFARSRLVITANLPAPRASRRASDARQRVNSFGGLAILAAIRRASSLVSNLGVQALAASLRLGSFAIQVSFFRDLIC